MIRETGRGRAGLARGAAREEVDEDGGRAPLRQGLVVRLVALAKRVRRMEGVSVANV